MVVFMKQGMIVAMYALQHRQVTPWYTRTKMAGQPNPQNKGSDQAIFQDENKGKISFRHHWCSLPLT
eukprot:12504337-Ditylum_brightwellii.AAC.1